MDQRECFVMIAMDRLLEVMVTIIESSLMAVLCEVVVKELEDSLMRFAGLKSKPDLVRKMANSGHSVERMN